MSRKIIIDKYQGNTHYSVHVIDSFGQEHHLGYLGINLTMEDVDKLSKEIWSNEVKREVDPLSFTIHTLHQHDMTRGVLRGNRDGLD
tara:strand:- start:3389 stop:3649 length:261 start_codon:yes stop_codon:yes gene_type:complete